MPAPWLPLLSVLSCPLGGDLLGLETPPAARAPAPPDLADELVGFRTAVVPGTLVGPIDLGERGAVVAAIRCGGKADRPRAPCDLVVAHLSPVAGALVLSGVVQTFPVHARARAPGDYAVTMLALRDLAGDAAPELVVRWRVGETSWLGALSWLGFTRVFGPERVADADCIGALALGCDADGRPELTAACGGEPRAAWRWDTRGARFVKRR